MTATPLVSIITATYNRSNVLHYTIASALRSTFTDWELLVIGDACTDDTEAVVAAFADPRIRFFNLAQNVGEQSGPNNAGFRYARGRYIAYLNHDDLWLPDHLATALHGIETTGADLVFTLGISIQPAGSHRLLGAMPAGRYASHCFVPASQWLLHRTALEQVGPWRFYRECYNVPSQDWLFRAWRAGQTMLMLPQVTVIAIQSGYRANVYARRENEENRYYYERMVNEADFREREVTRLMVQYATQATSLAFWPGLKQLCRNAVYRISLACGISPWALRHFVRHWRKGGKVDDLRARRGLPRLK